MNFNNFILGLEHFFFNLEIEYSTIYILLWLLRYTILLVHGLLLVVASLCGARALGVLASVVVARRLISCGTGA